MDGFKEKLVKTCGTDDVIRANSEAEARELNETRETLKSYEQVTGEIRRLNLKCAETNEKTGQLVSEAIEKLEAMNGTAAGIGEEDIQAIKDAVSEGAGSTADLLKAQEEYIHKENVRVYRNVQAAVVEELKLQTQALAEQNAELQKKVKATKGVAIAGLIFTILSFISTAGLIVMFILMMGL